MGGSREISYDDDGVTVDDVGDGGYGDDGGDGDDGDGDVDEYAIRLISSTLLCNQISLFICFWLHLR